MEKTVAELNADNKHHILVSAGWKPCGGYCGITTQYIPPYGGVALFLLPAYAAISKARSPGPLDPLNLILSNTVPKTPTIPSVASAGWKWYDVNGVRIVARMIREYIYDGAFRFEYEVLGNAEL